MKLIAITLTLTSQVAQAAPDLEAPLSCTVEEVSKGNYLRPGNVESEFGRSGVFVGDVAVPVAFNESGTDLMRLKYFTENNIIRFVSPDGETERTAHYWPYGIVKERDGTEGNEYIAYGIGGPKPIKFTEQESGYEVTISIRKDIEDENSELKTLLSLNCKRIAEAGL